MANVTTSVLDEIDKGEAFHSRRGLAIERPARAREKLDAYAVVSVKILKGRNLPMADLDGSSDPFVEVLLNDVIKAKTQIIYKSLNPVWTDGAFEIHTKSPNDVLMLRVMDYDWGKEDDVLGFAEIPVSDLEHKKKIQGWCILCPKESLEGTAPERLKTMKEPRVETDGAILVEMELRIVSNDVTDEVYAWCLPQPEFEDYPEGGVFTRADLNMQKIIDAVDGIQTTLMQRIIAPFKGFVFYVLGWKDLKLSAVFFACTLGMSLRPDYYLCLLFGLWGTVFAMLSDPQLRQDIIANPSTVPLNDTGFSLVASVQSTDQTITFIKRVVVSLRGKVLDNEDLRTYAAFATKLGKPIQTYEELCYELRQAGKKGKMVTFEKDALAIGTLVKCDEGRGRITKCIGEVPVGSNGARTLDKKAKVTEYLYEVTLNNHEAKEKAGAKEETVVMKSSEIVLRTDLRFLENPVVLGLIPNGVEDTIMGFLPTLKSVKNSLKSAVNTLDDLFGWTSPASSSTSLKACIGLFALSILCNPLIPNIPCWFIRHFLATWLSTWMGCAEISQFYAFQRLIFVVVTVFVFASSTEKWKTYFNEKKGKKLAASTKKTNGRCLGFFKDPSYVSPGASSKDISGAPLGLGGVTSGVRSGVRGWCGIFGAKND